MTREEQLNKYLKERNIPVDSLEANSIKEGIDWADENPKEGLVSIDKVCEWLENDCDLKDYLGGIFSGPCSINFDFEKLSNNLRKAMEE